MPDFAWPYKVAQRLSSWLEVRRHELAQTGTELAKVRFFRPVLQAFGWSCVAYVATIWVCLCYIYFPVPSYAFRDFVEWTVIVGPVTFGAIYALYAGSAAMALLAGMFLSFTVCFGLSLLYVFWVVTRAIREGLQWLKYYRPVLLLGFGSSLALATYVDGSYRFWDKPFEISHWVCLVFIAVSGWASLFCHLVRNQALRVGTRLRVVKWTVSLIFACGLTAHWAANGQRAEYFLQKKVLDDPKNVAAWLDLAWHYKEEGDNLQDDSGDEDHSPPDPTPSYRESLNCLNKAISLGAGGFDIQYARAELADELGDKQDAAAFGRKALGLAEGSRETTGDEREGRIEWLRDLIARNPSAESGNDARELTKQRVRYHRREGLPSGLRWVFHFL
ncbi:MAG TPA: hypothetical protein VHU83_15055 [Bryobacteraceae bacterium]|nr:hypothetical protein [Bryobacteraceae bacterium]